MFIVLAIAVVAFVSLISYEGYWLIQSFQPALAPEVWQRVADQLGMKYEEGLSGNTPYLTGVLDDVPVSAITEMERHGRSTVMRTVISATISSEALSGVKMWTKRGPDHLLGAVTTRGVTTGVREIDERFVTEADSPDRLGVLSSSRVRSALLEAAERCGDVRIENGEVIHRGRKSYTDETELTRMLQTITAVARAVDETVWGSQLTT
jgi:hypothetical protein